MISYKKCTGHKIGDEIMMIERHTMRHENLCFGCEIKRDNHAVGMRVERYGL